MSRLASEPSSLESCVYHHTNEYNNNTDDIQDITSRYVASAAFVNFLKSCDDRFARGRPL